MKKPKKKENYFDEDPYCAACRLSETFCQCAGYNQACDDWEKFLKELLCDKMAEILIRYEKRLKEAGIEV